jgi:YVTN family beta-propeller protein
MAVIDTKSGKIIKKIAVTDRPQLPMLTKDGKLIYVGIWPLKPDEASRGFIDVIDTERMEKIKTIPTTGGIHDMLITSDGKYLIAGSPMGKFLDCYDLSNDQLVWKLPFDRNVQTLTAETAPDGSTSRIFVNLRLPGFSIVDFKRHKEVSRIIFPDGKGGDVSASMEVADDKAGGGYFVPPGSGSAHGINIAPDGKTLWIDAMGYDTPWFNNVFVYSLPDLKLQGHVHMSARDGEGKLVGRHGQGHWQTFSPDGKMLYVVSYGLDWVSVIDTKAMKEVTRIAVGATPLHIEQVTIH